MKFSELAKYCESISINCDLCKCQKECSNCAEYVKELSPVGIEEMVKEDKEF